MRPMVIDSLEIYSQGLQAHGVPEAQIKEAMAKIQPIVDKQRQLMRQVNEAKSYKSANLALKQTFKMADQIDSILTEVIDDVKHEHMKYNHSKQKRNEQQ